MNVPNLTLADRRSIPQIGLGLWQVSDQEEFNLAFQAAIKIGYRHFDSAQAYHNEHMLGIAWKNSGLKRSELFITTKINIRNFRPHKVESSFQESLIKLQTNYVDLLLLHFPVTVLRTKAWQVLEKIHESGGAKSIGVSNYTIRHLEEMNSYAKVKPVVNQVELHVFLQQHELVKYCKENKILIEAYSPLAHAKELNNAVISLIAKKHHKSYAQIMLRWLLQQELVVLPKSVTPSRIRENIDIFDFKLDKTDLAEIAELDQDLRTCWSPVHVP